MLRTSLCIAAGLLALWFGVRGVIALREREDAHKLSTEAEYVLHAPLARAPELARIDAARARMLLEDALEIHKDPQLAARLAFAEALEEYQKGRLERSEQALARARAGLPASAELEVLSGSLALAAGKTAEAAAHADRALALAPGDRRARMLAADAAADSGATERAAALLASLLADEPAIGTLYNRRGLNQEALGKIDAARADFERATSLDPTLPQPYINLGRLLRDQGRAKEAEAAFSTAIERSSSEAPAWLGRGLSRIAQGDLAGGALDVQRARELAPAEPGPLVALADVDVFHAKFESAIGRYRAALVLAPDDAVAWLKLGNALARAQQYSDARDAFEHAIAKQPGLAAAHNGLGAALMGLGDAGNAEKSFATAATLDEHDPNPLLNLALLHTRQGDRRAARDAREQAQARRAESKLN